MQSFGPFFFSSNMFGGFLRLLCIQDHLLKIVTVLLLPFNLDSFFISFSCLITLARISRTVLNRSGFNNSHPCLAPDLRRKAVTVSLFEMRLYSVAMDFS